MKTIKLYIILILLVFIHCKPSNTNEQKPEISNIIPITSNDEKKIILGTLDWAPYVTTNLPGNGYVYRLVEEAFKEEGLEVEINFYPFARLLKLMEEEKLDGYFPEYFDPENNSVYYSDPYPGGDIGFIKLNSFEKDLQIKRRMEDFNTLKNLKIGVVRGYVNTIAFDNAKYLNKEEASEDFSNVKKVLFKRIDIAIIDQNVGNYLLLNEIQKYNANQLKIEFIEPGIEYKNLYTCFNKKKKNSKFVLNKFNSGMKKLRNSKKMTDILVENGFSKGRYIGNSKKN